MKSLVITHMDDSWSTVDLEDGMFWMVRPHGLVIKYRHGDGNRRVFPWANVKCFDVVLGDPPTEEDIRISVAKQLSAYEDEFCGTHVTHAAHRKCAGYAGRQ